MDGLESAERGHGQGSAHRGAAQHQEARLHRDEASEAEPARAQGRPDRELPRPAGGPREKKVGDVGRRSQERERNHRGEGQEERLQHTFDRSGRASANRRQRHVVQVTRVVRVLGVDAPGDGARLRGGRRRGHAGAETTTAAIHPQLRECTSGVRPRDTRGQLSTVIQNAGCDQRRSPPKPAGATTTTERGAVHTDLQVRDVQRSAHLGPQGVGEDRHGGCAGHVVLRLEEPATLGRDPEQLEVVARDDARLDRPGVHADKKYNATARARCPARPSIEPMSAARSWITG